MKINMQALLMYSNFSPSDPHVAQLQKLVPRVVIATNEQEALTHAADSTIILGHRYLRQVLPHTRRLQWVQTTAAGIDHLPLRELLRAARRLSRAPIFSDVIARHAFALAWAILRKIPDAVHAQDRHEWARPCDWLPMPRTAMVLGVGCVGRALAALLQQNGIRVLGVTRSEENENKSVCEEWLDERSWRARLAEVDLLFICLPLTRATRQCVDATALAALPRHAIVVNISRGGTLDAAALESQLRAGHLGGAALDVTEPSPLPASHSLWSTPRLLLTPHVSAFNPQLQPRLEGFMEEQVERFVRGQEPLHLVSRATIEESMGETP